MSICYNTAYTLLKCKLVGLSELMPLSSSMPEVLQDLHSLLRTWCAPALHVYMEHMFSFWGLLYARQQSAVFRSVEMSLSKTQSMSAERNLLSTVTVFQRLGVNVADLCRFHRTEL